MTTPGEANKGVQLADQASRHITTPLWRHQCPTPFTNWRAKRVPAGFWSWLASRTLGQEQETCASRYDQP